LPPFDEEVAVAPDAVFGVAEADLFGGSGRALGMRWRW
jgi:hypothetical protein